MTIRLSTMQVGSRRAVAVIYIIGGILNNIMYYEIIVTKNGLHLFATASRSCQTLSDMKIVYRELASRFKEEDGYQIMITRWETAGTQIDKSIIEK